MKLDETYLNISGIVEDSIVDGPGLRMTIFTQGCLKDCPGCHNPQTHALDGGQKKTLAEILAAYDENPLLSGLTFSGGEPFLQAGPLAALAREIHGRKGDIVTYSGYYYEELRLKARTDAGIKALLEETDMLIDGPFILARRDLDLLFRGSANQRILDREARKKLDGRDSGIPASKAEGSDEVDYASDRGGDRGSGS